MESNVDEQIAEAIANWHSDDPRQYLYEDVMKIVEAAIDRAVREAVALVVNREEDDPLRRWDRPE